MDISGFGSNPDEDFDASFESIVEQLGGSDAIGPDHVILLLENLKLIIETLNMLDAMTSGAKAGILTTVLAGGVDGVNWSDFAPDNDVAHDFPLEADDVEQFRIMEVTLLRQMALVRYAYSLKGIDVPLTPIEAVSFGG